MIRTLAIQSSVFTGLPSNQRNVALADLSFTGNAGDDIYEQLAVGATYTVPDSVSAFAAFTTGNLLVYMDSKIPMVMQELMISDTPVTTLSFTNVGSTEVQLHLTYIGEPKAPPVVPTTPSVSGVSGVSGISGVSGWSGTSGWSGVSGWSGISGTSGLSGVSGVSGVSGTSGWVWVQSPVTDFAAVQLAANGRRSVAFTDTSSHTPTSWLWDFGDGATSTLEDPTHVYAGYATYQVTLTTTNAYGSNSITKPLLVAA